MRVQSGQPVTLNKPNKNSTLTAETGSELSIADIVKMLARHKWFIAICVLICTAISLAYIKVATPIYEASASIRIDPGRAGSLGLAELTGFGTDPAQELLTEIAILKSDTVAIDTLNSLSDEEFKKYTGSSKQGVVIPPRATDLSPEQEGLLTHFKSQLSAAQLQETQLVGINVRDKNPQVAALLVNHVIQSYLRQSFDSRYGSVNQVKQWLSTEMDKLRDQAAQAQRKLADFQEANNILATDAGPTSAAGSSANTTTDRLSLLNNRLTQAQADRIVKEAQMRAAASGSPAVLSSLFPTPTLTALEADQSRLYAQYVQLSTKFGENYPPLVEVKSQMQKVDAKLEVEVSTIKKRLKQEFDASTAVENMLQKQYDLQTDKAYILNRKQAEYAILRVEGTSSRDLYNTLQVKLQQAGVDAGLNGVSTMMVDSARTPHLPVEPKKTAILSFGIVLGLFAGIASAFLLEATSDKLQSVEQAEHTLGAHLLSAIPHANLAQAEPDAAAGPPGKQVIPAMLVALKDPLSRQAEAYRTLRNAVLLSSIDSSPKTVLVTSTIAGEGKSSTAANYAIVLAQNGARVLLIDADLRRSTLHQKFGVPNAVGLSNLILGETVEEPFVTPFADLGNLFLLTAGKKVPLPSEALGSTKFYTLLQKWEAEFDHIIIDSAPLLIVSDSLPMASWADALILVTRYNFTPVSALKRIREVLNHTNAHVAGMILNDMPGNVGGYYGSYVDAYYR